jgi:hypothetical protein
MRHFDVPMPFDGEVLWAEFWVKEWKHRQKGGQFTR